MTWSMSASLKESGRIWLMGCGGGPVESLAGFPTHAWISVSHGSRKSPDPGPSPHRPQSLPQTSLRAVRWQAAGHCRSRHAHRPHAGCGGDGAQQRHLREETIGYGPSKEKWEDWQRERS
jgi:hypothetical protein